ncbi:unnamed protein product, partial [Ectocarpus sp. 12 AP-2014]
GSSHLEGALGTTGRLDEGTGGVHGGNGQRNGELVPRIPRAQHLAQAQSSRAQGLQRRLHQGQVPEPVVRVSGEKKAGNQASPAGGSRLGDGGRRGRR